jgi:DNA-binding NarL/FixJ family response regulator
VLKEMAPSLIVACIRKVAAGGQWLERDLATRALDRALAGPLPAMEALTAREREIVRLVARGARNREIGQALAIAEGTVKIHLHRIFAKLAVRSRVELANLAHDRFGL